MKSDQSAAYTSAVLVGQAAWFVPMLVENSQSRWTGISFGSSGKDGGIGFLHLVEG